MAVSTMEKNETRKMMEFVLLVTEVFTILVLCFFAWRVVLRESRGSSWYCWYQQLDLPRRVGILHFSSEIDQASCPGFCP